MAEKVNRTVTGNIDSTTAIASIIDDMRAAFETADDDATFDVSTRSSLWAGGGTVSCTSEGTSRIAGSDVLFTVRVVYRFGTWRTRSAPLVTTTVTRKRNGDTEHVTMYEREVIVGPDTDADDVYDLVDEDIAMLVRGPRVCDDLGDDE